jgi:hypothetical protein
LKRYLQNGCNEVRNTHLDEGSHNQELAIG